MVRKYDTAFGVIYNEDSKNALNYIDKNSVDLVYTDPPYGIDYEKYGTTALRGDVISDFGRREGEEWVKDFPYWFIDIAYDVMKDNRWGLIWLAVEHIGGVRKKLNDVGFNVRNTIVWVKGGVGYTPRPNFKNAFEVAIVYTKGRMKDRWNGGSRTLNVFNENIVTGNSKEYYDAGGHPSIKPLNLVLRQIPILSNKNDLVVDFFVGSGTTAVACELLQRRWIAFERDEKWFDVAVKRLKKIENKRLDSWFE